MLSDKESIARHSEDLTRGFHKDLYVQHQGSTADVIQVKIHRLVEFLYIVPAVDLLVTRYVRLHRNSGKERRATRLDRGSYAFV